MAKKPLKKSSTKKQPLKKVVKVERIKDPKKVLAGKIRQANAIKDSKGRFASRLFVNEIKKTLLATKKVDVKNIHADNDERINQLFKDAKLTPKQLKRFYELSKESFEDLKTFGKLKGTSKNSNQIEKAIDKYKGKIFINDGTGLKKVSKVKAKYLFANFKQVLSSNINVVDFYVKPTLSTEGFMEINLPDPKELRKKLKKKFKITNLKDLSKFESSEISEVLKEILEEMYEEPDLVIIIS